MLHAEVAFRCWGEGLDKRASAQFGRVISEFKSRYVLTYTPTGVEQGGWHGVEVRLKGSRAELTARRGYLRAPR
jgi:hypothetical protein